MNETLPAARLGVDEYDIWVELTDRREGYESVSDFPAHYSDLFYNEYSELLTQHGETWILMARVESGFSSEAVLKEYPGLHDGIVEELGDMFWITFRAARYLGIDIKDSVRLALQKYTGQEIEPMNGFEDIEHAVERIANQISVASKSKLVYPHLYETGEGERSLSTATFYVVDRMVKRLRRSLNKSPAVSPRTAHMWEPIYEPEQAIGDFVLAGSYLAQKLLDGGTQEVLRRNIVKNLQKLHDHNGR